jgi:hypothetical protein
VLQRQMEQLLPPFTFCAEEVQGVESRQGQERLQHFDIESQADDEYAQEQPAQFAGIHCLQEGPGRQQQHARQQAVDRVIAFGRNCHRHDRQCQCGRQPGPFSKRTPDKFIYQENGEHARQGIRQRQGKTGHAQEIAR